MPFLSSANHLVWKANSAGTGPGSFPNVLSSDAPHAARLESTDLGLNGRIHPSHKVFPNVACPVFGNSTGFPCVPPMTSGASPPVFGSFTDMHRVLYGNEITSSGPSSSSRNLEQENPNSTVLRQTPPQCSVPPPSSTPMPMALLRADPKPFLPRGMQWLPIANRTPVVRAVAVRPRQCNEELAIVTINPFPGNLVCFHNIREVVQEFLVDQEVGDYGYSALSPRSSVC